MEELKKSVERLEQKIDNNAVSIIQNMNKLHNHEDKINANAEKIQQNSYALDILKDYKHGSKRLFIILIIVLFMWFATIGYLVYILQTIDYVSEDTIEIQDVETIDNSHIKIGDDLWEKSN